MHAARIILLVNGNDQTFTALTIDFISTINTAGSPVLGNPEAPVNHRGIHGF
ncbi:MAG: hypothetical protein JKP90_21630 [Desulfofustis sp. PB-SRB1]|nr:hypothetical protein [Desulfofustis sp. PB-SRB1]